MAMQPEVDRLHPGTARPVRGGYLLLFLAMLCVQLAYQEVTSRYIPVSLACKECQQSPSRIISLVCRNKQ